MEIKRTLRTACAALALFILYTFLVSTMDVRPAGPLDSEIGFAGLNLAARAAIGENHAWYALTQILGLSLFLVPAAFAALGLRQLLQRGGILRVDKRLFVLGGFYVLLGLCYILFEKLVINYRPILQDGVLEASYPSSHTMLAVCIAASGVPQLRYYLARRGKAAPALCAVVVIVAAVVVVGRLLSGVHWLTDILGALLLSAALILFYRAALLWAEDEDAKA